MSTTVRQAKICAFSLPIRAARSRRYRVHAKDCNHCPLHPRSVGPVHEDAASAAVPIKPVWNGSVPISPPQPTKKPCASVRPGLNHLCAEGKTGMACAESDSGGLWRVKREALMRAAGQHLKRLLCSLV